MRFLGAIVRLQVQRSRLKLGTTKPKEYNPAPILPVPTIFISEPGALGFDDDGRLLMDVHHRDHSDTRSNGRNALSILFTSHYQEMRQRFGPHLTDGIAGESILVECSDRQSLESIGSGLVIKTSAGERINLDVLKFAPPCVEFTRFALQTPLIADRDPEFLEALDFLSHGTRGFYVHYSGEPVSLGLGDSVFLAETVSVSPDSAPRSAATTS